LWIYYSSNCQIFYIILLTSKDQGPLRGQLKVHGDFYNLKFKYHYLKEQGGRRNQLLRDIIFPSINDWKQQYYCLKYKLIELGRKKFKNQLLKHSKFKISCMKHGRLVCIGSNIFWSTKDDMDDMKHNHNYLEPWFKTLSLGLGLGDVFWHLNWNLKVLFVFHMYA